MSRITSAWSALLGRQSAPARPAAQLIAGSYRAADNPRRRTSAWVDGSGDFHLDAVTRRKLRTLSRSLERNSDLYDGLLTNWMTFLVGSGPRPVPETQSEEFNALAPKLFAEDAKRCRLDARGMFPWSQWVAMLARSVARDGNAVVMHSGDGRGQLLEDDRIGEVCLDSLGRITGMTFTDASTSVITQQSEVYPTRDFSLCAYRTRPSQTLGHPVLVAGLDDWERLDSLNEAEIVSAEAASLPWLLLKHKDGGTGIPLSFGSTGAGSAIAAGGATSIPATPVGWQRSEAGSIMGLPPGLDGEPWAPDRPNLNVPEFVRMNLRHLCLPLLPYEVAFLDIGSLNYAAIRSVGALARRRLGDFRTLILEDPISRMYRDWARAKILAKALPFTPDFAKQRWEWDELEIRDRDKDANAVEQEMANGTLTLQDAIGPNWRQTIDQLAIEREYRASKGLGPIAIKPSAMPAVTDATPTPDEVIAP